MARYGIIILLIAVAAAAIGLAVGVAELAFKVIGGLLLLLLVLGLFLRRRTPR
jgi:hypothetical protein